ncbi:sel1 repeat family protein [Pseudomonas helleri]|uniref:Sel1 repeat family protein n=1 Tax=Pseudomonas helleri TaxID=1608996 RepID=A0A6A7YTN5_9PSED|nr:sel1 repeat family protein [Pseudomonas helleri]MQT80362.1 sel1 repeat family protein [Pseudomonas helleri]MQU28913.1 sel1 repeat family protein [Pseudomonas helleri]
MRPKHLATVLASLLLIACNRSDKTPLKPLDDIKADLAFTCVHEAIPAPSTDTDVLFKYARWLQKNNQLKQDKSVDVEIERLYRIAAENGHYKANINLQNGAMRGHFQFRGDEYLRLSERLISEGVATGYYFVGIFLQQGSAGLKQDPEMALRYFRKAADSGNAQAQGYVGEKLAPSDMSPDIARQMRRCAAEQGNGEAALTLGINLQGKGRYQEALEALQLGVAAGDSTSAYKLGKVFRNPPPTDELNYLGQQEDQERVERYMKISKVLGNYSYASPNVPEINEILPLPPAKLPAWDGKLQWLEARLANIPPPKPTPELIQQLAKAKTLDPATGKPMPGSPGFSQAHLSAPFCYSGQPCPQSGYWKVGRLRGRGVVTPSVVSHFEQGDVFPLQTVQRYYPRFWPLSPKWTQQEEAVCWWLV